MIILTSAKQSSGKTTLTEQLCEEFKGTHLKFAETLYRIHNAVYEIMEPLGYKPTNGVADKRLLQLLGTEWGRAIDKDIWVKVVKNITDKDPDKNFFIDDARFENEFDGFPGALKIRLECDRDLRKARAPVWREDETHASEVSLDGFAKEGKFHFYIDTGVRGVAETFDLAVQAINSRDLIIDVCSKGGRSADDYFDLHDKIYSKW